MPRWIRWLLWISCTAVLLWCYWLFIPLLVPVPLTPTPLPSATWTSSPAPTATSSATTSATAVRPTATPYQSPTVQATGTPTVPAPTLTPLASSAVVSDLHAPVWVDDATGRLYAAGVSGARDQIVALASRDLRPLAAYDITGTFAVDGSGGWLYVDRGDQGLAVVRVDTGLQRALISLPASSFSTAPGPLADTQHMLCLAFRDASVFFVDPNRGAVARTWQTDVRNVPGSCSSATGPLPIQDAELDEKNGILYLEFVTYTCTPYTGYTIVAYELTTGDEIDRTSGAGPTGRASAGDGVLYGSSWNRMGSGDRWVWKPGELAIDSSGWRTGFAQLFVDPKRQRVLEAEGADIWVHDARNMRLTLIGAAQAQGELVALDSGTDQLYFLQRGQLLVRSAGFLSVSLPGLMAPVSAPTQPLRSIIAAAGLGKEVFLFGIWQAEQAGACWAFNQTPGELFVSSDWGAVWHHPTSGMDTTCSNVTTVAVSPSFTSDRTAWVGLLGLGLFRTIDGGNLWQSAGTGLSSQGWRKIWLSPEYREDHTMFALAVSGALYRSVDGGSSWKSLTERPYALAMSGEFGDDRTLLGAFWIGSDSPQRTDLRISRDAGETWKPVSEGTQGARVHWMGLAPLFAKWHVAFLWNGEGALLRTSDGGAHWQTVLTTNAPDYDVFAGSPPLVIAPGDEEHRALYLVASWTEVQADRQVLRGKLYRSQDGGLTWGGIRLPAGVQVTAIALSPHYQQDGQLFVGTSDGRMLTLQAGELAKE